MSGYSKILVPVDFSGGSKDVLRMAAFMAKKLGAELCTIFVLEDLSSFLNVSIPHLPSDLQEEGLRHGAEKKMEKFINENLDASVPSSHKVLSGRVAEEICRFAGDEGVDLIIMGTHGSRGVERLLLGSVAEKVLRMAPCPVLTVNTLVSGTAGS